MDVPLPVPGVWPPDEADGVAHSGVVARLEEVPPPCIVVVGGLGGIDTLVGSEPSAVRRRRWALISSLHLCVSGTDGGGTPIPLSAIFHPSLLGRRMSGGTEYRAWYNAHVSIMMRLPQPKPFAARTFLRDDDIVEIWKWLWGRGRESDPNGMWKGRGGRRGRLFIQRQQDHWPQ
jgi:hypothetical protein